MTLTRDQLRAARALLNLRQDQLATLAQVGVATIRHYEGGREVGAPCLDALRGALERAGALLLDGSDRTEPGRGVGVALRRSSELPEDSGQRIEGETPPG